MKESKNYKSLTNDDLVSQVEMKTKLKNKRILEAMRLVDRADFMLSNQTQETVYHDRVVDFGNKSSMSVPSLVAQMIDIARIKQGDKVLELGTASGYNASILSHLAAEVVTVEYNSKLANFARENFRKLGISNVKSFTGDGAKGVPKEAPFNVIIVTAGLRDLPKTLIHQLIDGGRIVAPLGFDPHLSYLIVGTKHGEKISKRKFGLVGFYPLISDEQGGWNFDDIAEIDKVKKRIIAEKLKIKEDKVTQEQMNRVMISEKTFRKYKGD